MSTWPKKGKETMGDEIKQLEPFSPENNRGVKIAPPKAGDYVLGVNSPLAGMVIEASGDWEQYVSTLEKQHSNFLDNSNCTGYGFTNDVEDQINRLIVKNEINPEFYQFLQDNGYFDENGRLNFSERALGALAGTDGGGNYLNVVADTARKFGLVPNKLWPWDPNIQKTHAQYFEKPPQSVIDLGLEFKKFIDFPYQWIGIGDPADINRYPEAMKAAPLYVALVTCGGWSTPPVKWCNTSGSNHAVVLVKYDASDNPRIQDSYHPYIKELELNYAIPWAMQVLAIQKKGIKRMIGYKLATSPKVYIQVGNGVLVPVENWQAFVSLGGSTDTVITITQEQLSKFIIREDVFLDK